jgi:hypothetical protein
MPLEMTLTLATKGNPHDLRRSKGRNCVARGTDQTQGNTIWLTPIYLKFRLPQPFESC